MGTTEMKDQDLSISGDSIRLLDIPQDQKSKDIASTSQNALRRASWWPQAFEEILSLARYPAGWDSHGAASPVPKLLAAGADLLSGIATATWVPKPRIVATRSGGIQFEWESGSRYFEIDVVAERAAEFLFQDVAGGTERVGVLFEEESLEPVLRFIREVESST
jgi:hypothetical protein